MIEAATVKTVIRRLADTYRPETIFYLVHMLGVSLLKQEI